MTIIKKIILTTLLAATPMMAQVKEKIEVPYVAFPVKMGKGFETVQANCLMCHSFGYIINQGRQSRAFWKGKIQKMIVHFKAPITDKPKKIIENYLFTHYGNGKEK